jgi:hypothetical protein
VPDRRPPAIRLRLASRRLTGNKLRVRVTCPPTERRCRVTIRATARGRALAPARTLRLRGRQSKRVALKLNARGRTLVSTRRRVRVRVTAVATDPARNRTTVRATFVLRRR